MLVSRPKPPKHAGAYMVHVGVVVVTLQPSHLPDGRLVLAADVSPEIAAHLGRVPGYTVHPEGSRMDEGKGEAVVAKKVLVLSEPDPVYDPRALAILNGWDENDIEGSGKNGENGPAGGRAQVTGLTLFEASISTPPKDWAKLRENAWPWEVAGWQPPVRFKIPAGYASKRKPEPEEETVAPPAVPETTPPVVDTKPADPTVSPKTQPSEVVVVSSATTAKEASLSADVLAVLVPKMALVMSNEAFKGATVSKVRYLLQQEIKKAGETPPKLTDATLTELQRLASEMP